MSLNCPPRLEYFDRSGVIPVPVDGQPNPPAFPYNPKRVGLDFQNQGTAPMWLVIMPLTNPAESKPTQYLVKPGESWYKDQFAPINEVRVIGNSGEPYAASEYGV